MSCTSIKLLKLGHSADGTNQMHVSLLQVTWKDSNCVSIAIKFLMFLWFVDVYYIFYKFSQTPKSFSIINGSKGIYF